MLLRPQNGQGRLRANAGMGLGLYNDYPEVQVFGDCLFVDIGWTTDLILNKDNKRGEGQAMILATHAHTHLLLHGIKLAGLFCISLCPLFFF